MATENIEIEVKYHLENTDELLAILHRTAEFKYESHQIDEYFNPPHRDFLEQLCVDGHIDEWFRLRWESDKKTINYKHWHQDNGESVYCDEYETGVDDIETVRNILLAVGFRPMITVDKTRTAFKMGDFEIAVDRLCENGDFIEIEYYGNVGNRENTDILAEIKSFAGQIGAKLGERNRRGYPFVALDKLGLLKY